MTISEIKKIVTDIDPMARHHFADGGGKGCTVWAETERIGLDADNCLREMGWKFGIYRYTKDEEDPMPARIEEALLKNIRVSVSSYRVDYDVNTGYITHSFECEAV